MTKLFHEGIRESKTASSSWAIDGKDSTEYKRKREIAQDRFKQANNLLERIAIIVNDPVNNSTFGPNPQTLDELKEELLKP